MEKNNYKKEDAGCDKYGKQRLELALYLKNNVLSNLTQEWFIENGTLLGAWRNGTFIPHDDDFDIAILIKSNDDILPIYNTITQLLINTKYNARIITTYASKIEIYDETYGKYKLLNNKYNGADYHYITLDLQFYLQIDKSYKKLYYISPVNYLFHKDILLPITTIKLENAIFNAPNNIVDFLKQNYGSLDPKASYNPLSGLYEI